MTNNRDWIKRGCAALCFAACGLWLVHLFTHDAVPAWWYVINRFYASPNFS